MGVPTICYSSHQKHWQYYWFENPSQHWQLKKLIRSTTETHNLQVIMMSSESMIIICYLRRVSTINWCMLTFESQSENIMRDE